MAHVIDYVEFAVDDLDRARAFYANALGWEFNDYGPTYAGIRDPRRPGAEFGGLSRATPASRGDGVIALVGTDAIEQTLGSVLDAGARLRDELHDYPGGRRFTFFDPFGNLLGVYQSHE